VRESILYHGPFDAYSRNSFLGSLTVTIEAPPGLHNIAKIYYTIDNTLHTTNSYEYTGIFTLTVAPGETAKRINLKVVAYIPTAPFYGDISQRTFILLPSISDACIRYKCSYDQNGNKVVRLPMPNETDAMATMPREFSVFEHWEEQVEDDEKELAPRPPDLAEPLPQGVIEEVSPKDQLDSRGVMEFEHESIGEALIKIPPSNNEEDIYFSLDGTDPLPGSASTFECGINAQTDKLQVDQVRDFLYNVDPVPDPDSAPYSQVDEDFIESNMRGKVMPNDDSTPQESLEGGLEEEEDELSHFRELGFVLSFRTTAGCEILLPPGKWKVKMVGRRSLTDVESRVSEKEIDIPGICTRERLDLEMGANPVMILQFEDGIPLAQTAASNFLATKPALDEDAVVWTFDIEKNQFETIGAKMYVPLHRTLCLKVVCPPSSNVHFSVNAAPGINKSSRRTKDDGLIELSYGINLVQSMCWSPSEPAGNITTLEVVVNGPLGARRAQEKEAENEGGAEEIEVEKRLVAQQHAVNVQDALKNSMSTPASLKIPKVNIVFADSTFVQQPKRDDEFNHFWFEIIPATVKNPVLVTANCVQGKVHYTINEPNLVTDSSLLPTGGTLTLIAGVNFLRIICFDDQVFSVYLPLCGPPSAFLRLSLSALFFCPCLCLFLRLCL